MNLPFLNFVLGGAVPRIDIVVPCGNGLPCKFPVTVRTNAPPGVRSSWHPVTCGRTHGGTCGAPQVNITCIPFSFPIGHPAGLGSAATKFRLVPLGPLTKIRNFFPWFALPKKKSASINPGAIGENTIALIRFAGFKVPLGSNSIANTEVTFVCPFGNTKQNPDISRFCGVPQSTGPLGVTDITTGARFPMSITHVVEKLNNPN
jgi:hypothetical protein